MLPQDKLELILRRHAELSATLAQNLSGEQFVALSRELAEIEASAAAIREWRQALSDLNGVEALLADPSLEADLRELAESERAQGLERVAELEHRIRLALLPKDAADEGGAILEIRAGTGGDEASLFAGDLFRMYERYAAKQGWSVGLISASPGALQSTPRSDSGPTSSKRIRKLLSA